MTAIRLEHISKSFGQAIALDEVNPSPFTILDEVWDGVLHINPAPSGRHAQLEAQLLAILRAPA